MPTKQFEYMTEYYSRLTVAHYDNLDIEKLNKLGEEGWELVTVAGGKCVFKREVKRRPLS